MICYYPVVSVYYCVKICDYVVKTFFEACFSGAKFNDLLTRKNHRKPWFFNLTRKYITMRVCQNSFFEEITPITAICGRGSIMKLRVSKLFLECFHHINKFVKYWPISEYHIILHVSIVLFPRGYYIFSWYEDYSFSYIRCVVHTTCCCSFVRLK